MECAHCVSVSVPAYQRALQPVCVYMDACVSAKLHMHEYAFQSVCASATVSTPLGLSTKPAQRQMGNFLRGKGKKKNLDRQQKQQDVCLSPRFFFRFFLKSDRVKDTETWRYLETVREKIRGDSLRKQRLKQRVSLWRFFSCLLRLSRCFWRICRPLSLYSILIKELVFIPSLPHQEPKLCLS